MRSIWMLLCVASVSTTACASEWKIHGGPPECAAMCSGWNMRLVGMVGVGSQERSGGGATACVCEVPQPGPVGPAQAAPQPMGPPQPGPGGMPPSQGGPGPMAPPQSQSVPLGASGMSASTGAIAVMLVAQQQAQQQQQQQQQQIH